MLTHLKSTKYWPFLLLMLVSSCSLKKQSEYIKIEGFCQGTTYHITYNGIDTADMKSEIDLLLKQFDNSLSTYNKKSVISQFNTNDSGVTADEYFTTAFNRAMEISEQSNGAFDITIAPIVNAWGFGFRNKEKITKPLIDSLLPLVNYRNVKLVNGKLLKTNPKIMLDCNALAQGYSVDLVCKLLSDRGSKNYMVEIGGEVRVSGVNEQNMLWKIGIEKPGENVDSKSTELQTILNLNNIAVSTSGDYKNFYIENGIKYAHTINPKTGYPARENILSATIIAPDCMTADAFATVCMVIGLEKSKELFVKHPELGGYLIYADKNGALKCFTTKNIDEMVN